MSGLLSKRLKNTENFIQIIGYKYRKKKTSESKIYNEEEPRLYIFMNFSFKLIDSIKSVCMGHEMDNDAEAII